MNRYWVQISNHPILVIVIVALLVRLLVSALYQHITLYPDSNDYIALADRLSNFNISGYGGQRPPGYPLLLCLTAISPLLTIGLQSILGIFTLIVAYKTLLLVGVKQRLSLIVTLLTACYLPIVFFELAILTETLTLFLLSLIFYQFFKLLLNKEKRENRGVAILVSLCGFLVLIKMFYIFLAFLLFGFLLYQRRSVKLILSKYVLILLAPAFLYLGWSYVNKVNTGLFVSSTFYGFNIAQNCVWFAENTTPEYTEIGEIYANYRINGSSNKEIAMTIWAAYPELQEKTGLSFPELSKRLYDYSIATIKLNPYGYLKQVFISWRDFWKTSLYWEPQNFGIPEVGSIVSYICYAQRMVLQLVKALFLVLIPYNLLIFLRRKEISPELIISMVVLAASLLQAFATYGTNSRFSYPFEILIVTSLVLTILQFRKYWVKQKTAP